jgi:hypothetical protein
MMLGRMQPDSEHDEDRLARNGVPPGAVVRLAIGVLAVGALYFALTADRPAELPSVALKQEFLYRCELFLVVLYGGLLTATPLLRGVLSGRLPTEITARGARYEREQVSGGLRQAQERIDQLADVVEATSGQLARLHKRIKQIEERD